MELTEPIESINQQLIDLFGIDTITGQPIFRVVWAAEQYEKRLSKFTREGLELINPEVMLLPKYDQRDLDYKDRWILERLVLVPEINQSELPAAVLSYEPLWVFRDRNNDYLPPTLWACKFVVDTVYAALGKKGMAKYVDEEAKNPIEAREKRINNMIEELFGNETDTGDALAHKSGVTVPGPNKES